MDISELKKEKCKLKAAFTKKKNSIERLLEAESSRVAVSKELLDLHAIVDSAIECISNLMDKYKEEEEEEKREQCGCELDGIDSAYYELEKRVRAYDSFNDNVKNDDVSSSMKRIEIPLFNGDKYKYFSWLAAFKACIGSSNFSPEYKLLQLRQYLRGEALSYVEGFNFSASGYEAAMRKLDDKYGGERRLNALHLDMIANLKNVRSNYVSDIIEFADKLEVIVANLAESNSVELNSGTTLLFVKKKIAETLLVSYERFKLEQDKGDNLSTLLEWVKVEANLRTIAKETVSGLSDNLITNVKQSNKNSFFSSETQKPNICLACNENHKLYTCLKFRNMKSNEKWQFVKDQKLCFRCLGKNHTAQNCKSERVCNVNGCKKTHNYLLHFDQIEKKIDKKSDKKDKYSKTTNTNSAYHSSLNEIIALRTIPVIIEHNGVEIEVNALLDEASTQTYINKNVVNKLGISDNSSTFKLSVNVLNGSLSSIETQRVSFKLKDHKKLSEFFIEALTVDDVTGTLPALNWDDLKQNYQHLRDLDFPRVTNEKVDLLIGMDYPGFHFSLDEVRGLAGEPMARRSILGWTCVAKISNRQKHSFFVQGLTTEDEVISLVLKRFWEIENNEEKGEQQFSPADSQLIEQTRTHMKISNGRFVLPLPWKKKDPVLNENVNYAKKRLQCTIKRLRREPDLLTKYRSIINEYEKKGYIRRVVSGVNPNYFIPHFPILKPEKETTKVRIVFDASAIYKGVSLNSKLIVGPKLQAEIFNVLLRFRHYKYAVTCDISEMYLQIEVCEDDKKYLNFLWEGEDGGLLYYQFNRLVFGLNCAPFLAQFALRELAQRHKDTHVIAADALLNSTYMDDTIHSVDDASDGERLINQMTNVLAKIGMKPRKWTSNNLSMIGIVPEGDKSSSSISFANNQFAVTKTLGVQWLPQSDTLTFPCVEFKEIPSTKRKILSHLCKLFDPLGLLSPFSVRAKIIMQNIWLLGTEWDEPVSKEIQKEFSQWMCELNELSKISCPRWLLCDSNTPSTYVHVFADASKMAYGAVAYVSILKSDSYISQLIASRSRVAPLKQISIPRLELVACVLAVRLGCKVCAVLNLGKSCLRFWTDSLNVIAWIKNQSRKFNPFIANRVSEIQSNSQAHQWKHVPSSDNPADLVSRGSTIEDLSTNDKWWYGPNLIRNPPVVYERAHVAIDVSTNKSPENNNLLDLSRFSNFKRAVGAQAYVFRFIHNCRHPSGRITGVLNAEELSDAEKQILRQSQRQSYEREVTQLQKKDAVHVSSSISHLTPFLDDDGIMRSSGRLQNADYLLYESRFPIILKYDHQVTELIVLQEHIDSNHVAGINQILTSLYKRFWIQSARELVKRIDKRCVICKRRKAHPMQQIMAPLPKSRVQKSLRPFTNTSVDYAGPFMTKQGRRRSQQKRYLCVFVCQETRAIHLEMSYSLSSISFISCFERFIARRGVPQKIISDNGRNFVGAQENLKEIISSDDLSMKFARKGIDWSFNPPLAPHFGGSFEVMVKAAKKALYFVLKTANCTDEELTTAFTKAEFLINSRPLTYISNNPLDEEVLTPNHFLFGQPGGGYSVPDEISTNIGLRWKFLGERLQHFWSRWIKEWIPLLNQRSKWKNKSKEEIIEGTIVMVLDVKNEFNCWRLGRIEKLYYGQDGMCRVVEVRVGKTLLVRPLVKLAKLL